MEETKKALKLLMDLFLLLLGSISLIIGAILIDANNSSGSTFIIIGIICFGMSVVDIVREQKKEKIKKEEQKQKDKKYYENGYIKIFDTIYINEKQRKININDSDYGFNQLIDCELVKKEGSLNSTYFSKNGRKALTSERNICTELYIIVTVDDFKNPNLRVYLKNYQIDEANKIISALKIIISKNNEKFIENGTITKVEHKYITEENASIQIERLSQLYKDGILNEYEFETKKKELLDKVK